MAEWLAAAAFLLLSSVLAPTFCSFAGGWLMYLIYLRRFLRTKMDNNGPPGNEGLKVIMCGFPRTGTVSLTTALRALGFRCLHGLHLSHPTTAKRYLRAYKSDNAKDWRKIFDEFTAVADYPGTCSYKELARVYPNAKIILSVRDANKWYTSFSNSVLRYTQASDSMVLRIVTTCGVDCVTKTLYRQFFKGKPEDREICINAFLQHTEDVKKHVPPEKLLVFNVEEEEGWHSLCQFLNAPIPDIPFLKSNNTQQYNDGMKIFSKVYTRLFCFYVAAVACVLWYII